MKESFLIDAAFIQLLVVNFYERYIYVYNAKFQVVFARFLQ